MIVQQKLGNLKQLQTSKKIDWLPLEWYETNKRILHKKTNSGKEVVMKFLKENQQLTQGDILFEDEHTIIAVEIIECDAIIILPKTMFSMASICYEIGNKHLPLFFQDQEVLVAYDEPLFKLLSAGGYDVQKGKRKLISPLKTTVAPHGHSSDTLFSKIMKLTTSPE
ncbi:MAG TPA: urease accessory protein UreE [Ferruginibacter sp.]|jgi:urease accessory protein|nr:urease accessory protein UreE [Ferruginibacter sp.]